MAHYVNNADFLKALIEYRAQKVKAEEEGKEKPIVSNYIGECILKIATHLSYKPNFINYSYRDDMILDGVENCIQYIDNFDPTKSNNPFSYFTQIIYYAFLRRIAKEKKQSYIKGKLLQNMPFEAFELQEHEEAKDFQNAYFYEAGGMTVEEIALIPPAKMDDLAPQLRKKIVNTLINKISVYFNQISGKHTIEIEYSQQTTATLSGMCQQQFKSVATTANNNQRLVQSALALRNDQRELVAETSIPAGNHTSMELEVSAHGGVIPLGGNSGFVVCFQVHITTKSLMIGS